MSRHPLAVAVCPCRRGLASPMHSTIIISVWQSLSLQHAVRCMWWLHACSLVFRRPLRTKHLNPHGDVQHLVSRFRIRFLENALHTPAGTGLTSLTRACIVSCICCSAASWRGPPSAEYNAFATGGDSGLKWLALCGPLHTVSSN